MKKKRKYIYLEKCLIIRILQIYIFSFYDFLFFISLSDVKLIDEYRVDVGGRYVRVIEQFQVLEFDRSGNIWLSLSILDVSPNQGTEGGVRSQLLNYRTGEVFPLPTPEASSLSGREREILRLISRGKLSKEIADQLNISVHTVNTHRQHILEKLNADNSMEAVRYASARGLLA